MAAQAQGEGPAAPARLAVLEPVARQTLQEQVHAELRASLIRGAFASGEVLRLRELAQHLGSSTMPVREALGRLVSERALEALPHRSVRVPHVTRATLEDLAQARALVEGELAVQALPRLTGAERARLRRLTEDYDALTAGRLDTARAAADLNHAFHFTLYRAAGSAVLVAVAESLWLQSGPYIREAAALYDRARDAAATAHHHALLAAIDAGDAEAARRALVADIGRAFDILRRRYAFAAEAAA